MPSAVDESIGIDVSTSPPPIANTLHASTASPDAATTIVAAPAMRAHAGHAAHQRRRSSSVSAAASTRVVTPSFERDLRDVVLCAVHADAEALGDLFVREVAAQQVQHLALAVGQLGRVAPAHAESIFAPLRKRGTTRKRG